MSIDLKAAEEYYRASGFIDHPEITALFAELTRLRAEVERLRGELTDKSDLLDDYTNAHAKLTADLAAMRERAAHFEELAADSHQMVMKIQAERDATEQARARAETELAAYRNGGVTEEILRRQDGQIHIGNGCEIAIRGTTEARARAVEALDGIEVLEEHSGGDDREWPQAGMAWLHKGEAICLVDMAQVRQVLAAQPDAATNPEQPSP